MKLDIMYDNWLPVVMCDGTSKEVSLYTAITEAQNIRKLQKIGNVNIREYSIYSFIFDFVQWVYKPEAYDEEDKKDVIEELFEKGKFDSDVLDEYIDAYIASGKSFDLFDEEHPFLQMSKEEWDAYPKVKKPTPLSSPKFGVGYLSGYNTTFEHPSDYVGYDQYCALEGIHTVIPGRESKNKTKVENIVALKPVELLASILYCIAYKHSSGGGSFSSISIDKEHPIFVIIEGKNLFETICASIGVSDSYNAKPLWERDNYVLTSTELNSANYDNNIALSYTPTVRLFPCDYSNIYESNLTKGPNSDFMQIGVKKNGDKQIPIYNTPNKAYEKWVNNYPRVMRTRGTTKEGASFVSTLCYTHENILSKNPKLQTNLLELESNAGECDAVKINYAVLKNKTDLKIHYYALAYKNANQQAITNYSETFEWNKKINPNACKRLPAVLNFIAVIAKETAKAINECDYNARTRCANKETESVSKAILETDSIIDTCLYTLEHQKHECLESKNTSDYLAVYDWLTEAFKEGFKEHLHYLPRSSILEHAKTENKYFKTINVLRKKALENIEFELEDAKW